MIPELAVTRRESFPRLLPLHVHVLDGSNLARALGGKRDAVTTSCLREQIRHDGAGKAPGTMLRLFMSAVLHEGTPKYRRSVNRIRAGEDNLKARAVRKHRGIGSSTRS